MIETVFQWLKSHFNKPKCLQQYLPWC